MALLEIITLPNPILRRKAHKVTDFGKEFKTLVDDMIETMRDAPGVGLAAPQVAIPLRLIVVEYGDDDDEDAPKKLFVVANPEIIEKSEEMAMGIEGCLSVPDLIGEVERHESITVKGLNRHGMPFKIKASGWLARIFQHEIDHVEGVVYTDLTDKIWKPTAEDETPLD
jgi:peptide deformylase